MNKKLNKRKSNKKKSNKKKLICIFTLLLYMLSEPVLLCGCASTNDELSIEFSGTYDDMGADINNENYTKMTEVSDGEDDITMVYIYVCGAVELPGVYQLKKGSRLYEAVEMAGGMAADADDVSLNMAREIIDGEQIVILTQSETAMLKETGAYPFGGLPQGMAAEKSGLVNINTADKSELTTVSGIGESRAQAIIDYRESNGSFKSIEDIKNVEGIKDGLFAKIKDKITV